MAFDKFFPLSSCHEKELSGSSVSVGWPRPLIHDDLSLQKTWKLLSLSLLYSCEGLKGFSNSGLVGLPLIAPSGSFLGAWSLCSRSDLINGLELFSFFFFLIKNHVPYLYKQRPTIGVAVFFACQWMLILIGAFYCRISRLDQTLQMIVFCWHRGVYVIVLIYLFCPLFSRHQLIVL